MVLLGEFVVAELGDCREVQDRRDLLTGGIQAILQVRAEVDVEGDRYPHLASDLREPARLGGLVRWPPFFPRPCV